MEMTGYKNEIKLLVKVASQMMRAVNGGRIKIASTSTKFSFKAYVLTRSEHEFWRDRSSTDGGK
jgi:hypothetical protein